MFKTIRSQLLGVFLLAVFVCVISSFISFWYIGKTNREIFEISAKIEQANILLLRDVKVTRDFFACETINPSFFISRKSPILDKHHAIQQEIKRCMDSLLLLQAEYSLDLETPLEELRSKLILYQAKFDGIVSDILIKGFKDYGIEGTMREHAHRLERMSTQIGLANVLQLRRHEKDFIIRQDDRYIERFLDQYLHIKNLLRQNKSAALLASDPVFSTLEQYRLYFEKFVLYEKKIGLRNQAGSKRELDVLIDHLSEMNDHLLKEASLKGQVFLKRMNLYVLLVWSLFILGCVFFSITFSRRFSRSVNGLNDKIEEFLESDFTARSVLPVKDSTYEIDLLSNNFSIMEQHIVNQMNALKERNKEMRTFIYRASHDIRGPVSTVLGLTSLAQRFVKDEQSLDYFKRIELTSHKQVEVIEELATVFNIKETGLEISEVDPFEIIRACIRDCREIEGFEKIVFSIDVNLKNKLNTDKVCLRAILKHLLENSVRYARKELASPRVSVVLKEEADKMLTITVSDNGIGINKDSQPHIFEMFYRGTDVSTGTGLGLYIVQNALLKLNGAIEVKSEEGQGAAFIVHVPNAIGNTTLVERIIKHKKRSFSKKSLVLDYL